MTEKIDDIEDQSGQFPTSLLLLRDIFSFSFDEAYKLSLNFSCNAELFESLNKVSKYISESDLDADEAEEIIAMINQEMEAINFSQKSRSSVIAL